MSRFVAEGCDVRDTAKDEVVTVQRTPEIAERVATSYCKHYPKPSEVVNGHGLFIGEWNGGNMGAQYPVFQASCTCGGLGQRTTSKEGLLVRWRRHAENSPPRDWA